MTDAQRITPLTEAEYLAFARTSPVRHEFVAGTIRAMVGAAFGTTC